LCGKENEDKAEKGGEVVSHDRKDRDYGTSSYPIKKLERPG
jgi:hypothetical protein